jgi:hypothetical protein
VSPALCFPKKGKVLRLEGITGAHVEGQPTAGYPDKFISSSLLLKLLETDSIMEFAFFDYSYVQPLFGLCSPVPVGQAIGL